MESQCIHGWWCIGRNRCFEVTFIWFFCDLYLSCKIISRKCIESYRRATQCRVILCIWHVWRAWKKNIYRLASTLEQANVMLNRLSYIMNSCLNVESVVKHVDNFFTYFANEKKFLDYFHSTWVTGNKICKFTYSTPLFLFFLFHKYYLFTNLVISIRDVG